MIALQPMLRRDGPSIIQEYATGLFSQQVWCWGRDILRTEGNWLVEIGFQRLPPPRKRRDCSSIYTLELATGRFVMLRGFGAFYGDKQRGGVFLGRSDFTPRYSRDPLLPRLPWLETDLPPMHPPTLEDRGRCASLTLELLDWIRSYEVRVAEQLGIAYRRETLIKWNNGCRHYTPAERLASAWRQLSIVVAGNFDYFLTEPRR